MSLRWTPERMDRLESAARRGLRVTLARRGSEYVVTARRLAVVNRKESFIGFLPMTGEELSFALDEIDAFEVIGL
jgi:hypothetical protein